MHSLDLSYTCRDKTTDAGLCWSEIVTEAIHYRSTEPQMALLLEECVLRHQRIQDAMAVLLAGKLDRTGHERQVYRLCQEVYENEPELEELITCDLLAVRRRDPACFSLLLPFLFFKGFHALQEHRIAHCLWRHDRKLSAIALANASATVFSVDIHPAARIGSGVMIDHATGVVIGETAVVGDDVSILHGVTLGSNGHEFGDRHPKIGSSVLIGAGATLLGNIHIGDNAKIGAGAVVLKDVPANHVAIGIPARYKLCHN